MLALSKVVRTFPSARLPSQSGGLPVEVSLIAQLGVGAGDHLFDSVTARQQEHGAFVDALDEPSARLGAMDLSRGDPTSLYTFSVGAKGHPFHRHAGHRVFTAISGSGGAQLRFSSASPQQLSDDPTSFLRALRFVDIPPDSLFTVRFGGETWHQFAPLAAHSPHPAFFALSCHTNELGGALAPALRLKVMANEASIPALTELLPSDVQELLGDPLFDRAAVPTIALALHAPAGSRRYEFCQKLRGVAGRWRVAVSRLRPRHGFLSDNHNVRQVVASGRPASGSLLLQQFPDGFDHQDQFTLSAEQGEFAGLTAAECLARLLEGFLHNRPPGVSRLMRLRNVLVRPLRLRTSPLGCPVSSLLCANPEGVFAGKFPVLSQREDLDGRRAQVILGADDRHLRFRSCVAAEMGADGRVRVSLGTRVHYRNWFGRFYMAVIDRVHRHYIAPAMLRMALDHAVNRHG